MKQMKKSIVFFILLALGVFLGIRSNATEVPNADTPISELTQEDTSREEEVQEASSEEAGQETEQSVEEGQIDVIDENWMSESEENFGSGEDTRHILDSRAVSDASGLYYYISAYLYEHQVAYYDASLSFLKKKKEAQDIMLQLGELTAVDLQACQAEISMCSAELQVARNEKAYCDACIKESGQDFSYINLEEIKPIYDFEYYKENYPEREPIQLLRYITDFENAVLHIKAQQEEINAVKASVKAKELLYQTGEISELELLQEKLSLEEKQCELAKYYVNMNTAYYNLEEIE